VLRGQVFAGDALSHVAFVGAIAPAAIGVDVRVGLFALTLAIAAGMAGLGRRAGEADDAAIGTVFAWILGIGVLLLAVLATTPGGGSGVTLANTLFGSIFSLTPAGARIAAAIALAAAAALGLIVRPLLLSTLDVDHATARGVPTKPLGVVFLALLAVITAESTQAVGALLLLGLIAAPAGAAHQLTTRPYAGVLLSAGIAVAAMWAGLALAYAVPALPPSSAIIGLAALAYLLAVTRRLIGRRRMAFLRSSRSAAPQEGLR
jgi:zinc/manganese transport system permease protein